jgi:hypothetical protein
MQRIILIIIGWLAVVLGTLDIVKRDYEKKLTRDDEAEK